MPREYDDGADDRRDDEYDDRPRRRGSADPAAGKRKLLGPGIGLLVTGLLGLGLAGLNVVNMGDVGPQLEERIRQLENDPNIPAQQKKAQVDMFRQIKGGFEQYGLALYGTNAVVALLVAAGGGLMLVPTGRGLSYLGAILAMVPIVNGCCCVFGLPFGIWALVALSNPAVKAAYGGRSAADY